jgi:hypothetical protein
VEALKAMRHIACVLLGLLLSAICCSSASAEESRFRFWPFSRDRANDVELTGNSLSPNSSAPTAASSAAVMPSQTATGSYSNATMPEQRWMIQSPMSRVSWPRIHMPEFSMPRSTVARPQWWSQKPPVEDSRNTWVQKSAEPPRTSPLQAMQQGAQRVGQSTRTAWRKTVDALTPGDASAAADPRVAARDQKPPFWKRLGGTEQPQKQGSQTVSEMLSQERIDF